VQCKFTKSGSDYSDCATMIAIQIAILPVLAILIVVVSHIIYRTAKRASKASPKTQVVSRGTVENDESASETKEKQVVGMINCKYCGSPMSQNAMVCRNCGAPRKE